MATKFEIKNLTEDGTFEGYGSTFGNVDSDRDIIAQGAFAESLAKKPVNKIKMLWQHDRREPIGYYETIQENASGLYVKGKLLLGIARAREAYELLKANVIDSFSIGFRTLEDSWDRENEIRTIEKVDLMEISLVTFPANDHALISAVKATDRYHSIKELEVALRDELGLSHRQSRKAAPDLWRLISVRDEREQDEDEKDISSALQTLADSIRDAGKSLTKQE
jgi:hypothetical protein